MKKEMICLSFPNIPNIKPDIDLDEEDVLSLLLASIALEELSLAHIMNAEAEKLQAVLGTLTTSASAIASRFAESEPFSRANVKDGT